MPNEKRRDWVGIYARFATPFPCLPSYPFGPQPPPISAAKKNVPKAVKQSHKRVPLQLKKYLHTEGFCKNEIEYRKELIFLKERIPNLYFKNHYFKNHSQVS